jgi:hypothetical protein
MQATKLKGKLQGSDSHWFLFLLLPFFAGVTAVRNYKAPWAKNMIWAFIVFYGFTFAIANENNDTDIVRYIDELKELYGQNLSFSDMIDLFKSSGEADVLRTIVAILVSRFTDSTQVLTAVYGFIFGFFFSRTIWYLINKLQGKLKWITVFFLIIFFLVDPFWNLNGFRFNTAIWVFVYGAMPYLFEKKKSKLIWSFLSVLVHFSFLFPVAILILYMFAQNRKNIYFGFFIISIFITNINVTELNRVLEANLPAVFVERSEKYRDEENVEEFRQSDSGSTVESEEGVIIVKNWYAVYYFKALYWSIDILLIALFIFGDRVFAGSKWILSGYCFSLLFAGFAHIMQSLPSGERYFMVAALFSLATIIFYLQNQAYEKYITKVSIILTPLLLVFFIVSFRLGLYSTSVTAILGNPILAIFTDYNLSLNDIIK